MSYENDQASDVGSDQRESIEPTFERTLSERVLFENVADQYAKGDDITVFFSILDDTVINPEQDRIGLKQIGFTKAKDCILSVRIELTPAASPGAGRYGTATFPSESLPKNDEEFYQFCYITDQNRILGSSLPFQVNCQSVDSELLLNALGNQSDIDEFVEINDTDQGIIHIQTRQNFIGEKLRKENGQLTDIKHQLEAEIEKLRSQIDLNKTESEQTVAKLKEEMEEIRLQREQIAAELNVRKEKELALVNQFDEWQKMSGKYQNEAVENAQRCATLEESRRDFFEREKKLQSQLAVAHEFTREQATKIVDLENQLLRLNENATASNRRQELLEQQLRDSRLTHEKAQRSAEGQIEQQKKEIEMKQNMIESMVTASDLLKSEIHTLKEENQAMKLSKQLEEDLRRENDTLTKKLAHNEAQLEALKSELESNQMLKVSLQQIKEKCLKHQKTEVQAKSELMKFQSLVQNLNAELEDLRNRLEDAKKEYKILYLKSTEVQKDKDQAVGQELPAKPNAAAASPDVIFPGDLLGNSFSQNDTPSMDEGEVKSCPVCYCKFADHLDLNAKREHIEQHFSMIPH